MIGLSSWKAMQLRINLGLAFSIARVAAGPLFQPAEATELLERIRPQVGSVPARFV